MSDSSRVEIPLDRVAPDARELIRAFREGGRISFQSLPLSESRATYVAGCHRNGPAPAGEVDTEDVVLAGVPCRVYTPSRAKAGGDAILFFHGGGWVIGDLDSHDLVCRRLASESGLLVIAVEYRLAPEAVFPAAHDDALAVAAEVLGGTSARRGIAHERLIVVGDSAGASLAAWVARAAAAGDLPDGVIGQVLLYPVTDLTFAEQSHRAITSGFPLTADSMRWFANHYAPQVTERSHPALSPLLHLSGTGAQAATFVATVGLDPLADEGMAYARRLAETGTPVTHRHFPEHAHGLITSAGVIPTGDALLSDVAAFIRDRSGVLSGRSSARASCGPCP